MVPTGLDGGDGVAKGGDDVRREAVGVASVADFAVIIITPGGGGIGQGGGCGNSHGKK